MFYLVRIFFETQNKTNIHREPDYPPTKQSKLVPKNGVVQLFVVEIKPKISTF
jgi:hypothetical protein